MTDEIKEEKVGMEADYLEQIKILKETTVDKDKYDKMLAENRRLLNTIVNGEPKEEPKKEKIDVEALKSELFTKEHSNLEYVKMALELRDALMQEGGDDPFLPHGHTIAADGEAIKSADKVAKALSSCVEYANGDSQLFTNELQRITRDVIPNRGR